MANQGERPGPRSQHLRFSEANAAEKSRGLPWCNPDAKCPFPTETPASHENFCVGVTGVWHSGGKTNWRVGVCNLFNLTGFHPRVLSSSRCDRLSQGDFTMADNISRNNDRVVEVDAEKERIENLEHVAEPQPVLPHVDPARRVAIEKSLKRKLDARCSLFVLIYIMNYLDRNNISAARLKGLQRDLDLTYNQYSTCLSILYVGYILMQVPSNMIINRIQRPSIYIAISMTLWGLISTLSGNAKNFGHMVAIRFLLGFVEAAFLPGALLILSKWYTRKELTTRNAILFCGNLISNAFSSLVAAGVLSNMEGVMGHAAWRWLFWIEGAITMFIAISAGFILPDLPTNARGFTEEERLVAQLRIIEDVGEADTDENETPWSGLLMALKDGKIYLMMLSFTAYVVGLSFNAFFVSTFSKDTALILY